MHLTAYQTTAFEIFLMDRSSGKRFWLRDTQKCFEECSLLFDLGMGSSFSIRLSKFTLAPGSCTTWVCMQDFYDVVQLSLKGGKGSLWVQNRLQTW